MKATMKISITSKEETIDLTDFGHDEDVSWEDLSEEEKCEVRDFVSEQTIVYVTGENYEE